MDKPRLFLDVDGPINADQPGPRVWQSHWKQEEVRGFVLRYNPNLINHIRNLVKGGLIEVAWCTTWVPYADELEKAFMLPPMLCAFEDCTPYTAWTEKVRAVENFNQTSDQRWVWIDDEAPIRGSVYESLTASGLGLIIKPSPYTGITPEELQQVKEHFGLVPQLS